MFTVDPLWRQSPEIIHNADAFLPQPALDRAGILPKDPKATATKKPLVLRMPERFTYLPKASLDNAGNQEGQP
jgi:hypothetical protein